MDMFGLFQPTLWIYLSSIVDTDNQSLESIWKIIFPDWWLVSVGLNLCNFAPKTLQDTIIFGMGWICLVFSNPPSGFFSLLLSIFDTEYDQAKVPPYNGSDPRPPLVV